MSALSALLLTILVVSIHSIWSHEVLTREQLTEEVEELADKVQQLEHSGSFAENMETLGEKLAGSLDKLGKTLTGNTGQNDSSQSDNGNNNLPSVPDGLMFRYGQCRAKLEQKEDEARRCRVELEEKEEINTNFTKQLGQAQDLSSMAKDFLKQPASCVDVMKYDRQDGIHWLNANGFMVRVFCDQTTDGGGWTVIQRRQDGSEHFFRHWDPYVEGFGDFQGEFWLGLDKIHRLTTVQKQMLRVDLQDFSGQTAYAKYSTFRVAGPSDKYRLTVSGYSGSAGDSLTFHNNQPFSTYDRDNDAQNTNCAVINHGAWWYRNCGNSNLNARYKQSAESGFGGITWLHWKNKYISLKKTEMKIRPAA